MLAVAGYIAYPYYQAYTIGDKATFSGADSDVTITVGEGSNFNDLATALEENGVIDSKDDFQFLANFKKFGDEEIPFRKLKVLKEWNTYNALINNIHYAVINYKGTVDVVINNVRNVADVAGVVSHFIDADSTEVANVFTNDSIISHYGFNSTTWPTFFLPNTYECYTDITPEEFIEKMAVEYKAFWNEERQQKARDLGYQQSEVTILASIVYEEQKVKFDEQAKIAGLYINRLKNGWKLQADPTVKYALGDFTLKRLLYVHLEVDSPYNTYMHGGLPPGPISIPEPRTIDAVLDYEKHDYFYMCAKPEYSGYHNFSKTLSQHNTFAKKYQQWLNSEGIR